MYIASLKNIFTIVFIALFAASNLLMPYANFDDTKSLGIVYNNCLANDADMNFLEFIGEKLLAAGFEDEDEEEGSEAKAHAPIDGTVIVQIQSGVMYHPTQQLVQLAHMPTIRLVIPLENSSVRSQEFHPFIFHPPAMSAA